MKRFKIADFKKYKPLPCKSGYKKAIDLWGKDGDFDVFDLVENGFNVVDLCFMCELDPEFAPWK